MSIYYPSGKYKLAILSFLEYCYRIFGTQYFVRAPPDSKGCLYLVDDKNVHKYFFPVLNLTIIKPFTCNDTIFSVSFLYEILFLYRFFEYHHHQVRTTAFKTWQNTDWLTDSASIHGWYSFPNTSIPYNSVASYLNFYVTVLYIATVQSSGSFTL